SDLMEDLINRGADFCSLSESVDPKTPAGRFQYHVLAASAEYGRAMISMRTKEGMAAAKARGAVFGRPRKLSRKKVLAARDAIREGRVSLSERARALRVSPLTLARSLKRLEGPFRNPDRPTEGLVL